MAHSTAKNPNCPLGQILGILGNKRCQSVGKCDSVHSHNLRHWKSHIRTKSCVGITICKVRNPGFRVHTDIKFCIIVMLKPTKCTNRKFGYLIFQILLNRNIFVSPLVLVRLKACKEMFAIRLFPENFLAHIHMPSGSVIKNHAGNFRPVNKFFDNHWNLISRNHFIHS